MSARGANRARNALGGPDRRERWRPARDALWALLDRYVAPGARVAIAGAGNADDLPLTRLLARAGHVDLIDLDERAPRRALKREPAELRGRARVLAQDLTGGAADAIVRAVRRSRAPDTAVAPATPLGDYDVAVGDLFYTQLLYPALLETRLSTERIDDTLVRYGQPLCGSVVARLHASAPVVVHVHDALGWWERHDPGGSIGELLALEPRAALARARELDGPWGSDVATAVEALGARVLDLATWRWPFTDGVDYFVYGLVATSAAASTAAPARAAAASSRTPSSSACPSPGA